jgi:potassium/hydrogen antiporter
MEVAVFAAGLFIFLAHLLDYFFERTRVPDILLLMLLGVLVGPVAGLMQPSDFGFVGEFLSVVTLVVILCASGLGLKFQVLLKAAPRATPFALFSMLGAVGLIALFLNVFLGLDSSMAILGAFILGGTSSAVVIPVVKGLGATDETSTLLTVESALTDVLCIIATVGIATSIQGGEGVAAGSLVTSVIVSLGVALVAGTAAGLVWAFILSIAPRLRASMHTTLAFALVIYGCAELAHVSGAIATLVFGITLGNLPEDLSLRMRDKIIEFKPVTHTEKQVYSEVVFLLKAFFFFYLGLTIRPIDFLSGAGVVALLLALAPFIPRLPAVQWIMDKKTTTRREALLSWALVPRGLAAAVLAQIPVQLGLPDAEILASTVAMMVFLSITTVAVCIVLIEKGKLDAVGARLFSRFPLEEVQPSQTVPSETRDSTQETEALPAADAGDIAPSADQAELESAEEAADAKPVD